jgi:hypothetical protein
MAIIDIVSIVTTINHNIGDDFVREGIVSILNDVVKIGKIECIHKHSPVTVVYGKEYIRNLRVSRIVEPVLRSISAKNRITDADLLIQSGAPIYWCHENEAHCADNEWYNSLIRKRFLKDKRDRKFLNIAGGSCQRYYSDGSEINNCSKCKSYIAEFFDASDLTLLRDDLAKKMLNAAGRDAEVLPCTSIFAKDRYNVKAQKGDYIAVNFMENGGHYTFGQSIDALKWRNNFALLVKKLKHYGRVVAACHTQNEEDIVKKIVPDIDTYIVPNDHVSFMNFYSKARFAIVNRVHAGFMMASFGKPVAVIGNDSRALMINKLSLSSYYVDDINVQMIDNIINELLYRELTYKDEFEVICVEAREKYVNKISEVIM